MQAGNDNSQFRGKTVPAVLAWLGDILSEVIAQAISGNPQNGHLAQTRPYGKFVAVLRMLPEDYRQVLVLRHHVQVIWPRPW